MRMPERWSKIRNWLIRQTVLALGPQLSAFCVSLTHSGGLSHSVYSFCSVQPWLASSSSMSKCQSIRDKIERSSKYASLDRSMLEWPLIPLSSSFGHRFLQICEKDTHLFPIHPRGPSEKGCSAAMSSSRYWAGGSGSQRSGTNVSGEAKLWLLRYVAHWWTPTEIFRR